MSSEDADDAVRAKLYEAKALKTIGNEFYKNHEYIKAKREYLKATMYLKGIDADVHGGSPAPLLELLGRPVAAEITPELEKVKIMVDK